MSIVSACDYKRAKDRLSQILAKKHSSRINTFYLVGNIEEFLYRPLAYKSLHAGQHAISTLALPSSVLWCLLTFHSHEREVSLLPLLIFQSRNGSYQMTQWRNLSQTLYNSPISIFRQAAIMKAQTQRSCSNLSIISIASILFYCAGFLRTEMELSNQRKKITALEDFVDAMKVHEGFQGTSAGRYCKGTVLFVDLEKLSWNFPSLSLAICHNLCHPLVYYYRFGVCQPYETFLQDFCLFRGRSP